MLRRVSVLAVRSVRPTVLSRTLHSEQSALYAPQEEIKKNIVNLKKELEPVKYERDSKILQFVNQAQADAAKSTKSLASLKIDTRTIKDSTVVHESNARVVY